MQVEEIEEEEETINNSTIENVLDTDTEVILVNNCTVNNTIQILDVENFRNDPKAMHFYTGLLDYETFQALFNFIKPKEGYQLNYHSNKQTNATRSPSRNKKGRARKLPPENELFLTLCRLRLNLLEQIFIKDFRYQHNLFLKNF